MFNALVLDHAGGTLTAAVRRLDRDALPEGEVLVSVLFSSINYKDGLAVTGRGKIIRGDFPFVPGIDLVGRVEESAVDRFSEGDLVVLTGGGLGERFWGGYSQQQRVPAEYLVRLPESMTPLRAMEVGTAGFTAMLAVMALEERGLTPEHGEVVVTGASGGVGSFAVALLANLGYTVVASSGSEDAYAYLERLGAARILPRDELGEGPQRPLESARWAGAVDTVGGATLAAVLSQLGRHAAVAACGNAGGHELHTTVYPFILRGVALLGIDSNTAPYDQRCEAWKRLSWDLPKEAADLILGGVIHLDQVPAMCEEIIQGGVRGRIVVDVNA
ncbi:MAG: MDR family oxidoreductase [Rhodothermales bacterium]|nr:MDR family oxidoreductase [Rhodothermales bacterium]